MRRRRPILADLDGDRVSRQVLDHPLGQAHAIGHHREHALPTAAAAPQRLHLIHDTVHEGTVQQRFPAGEAHAAVSASFKLRADHADGLAGYGPGHALGHRRLHGPALVKRAIPAIEAAATGQHQIQTVQRSPGNSASIDGGGFLGLWEPTSRRRGGLPLKRLFDVGLRGARPARLHNKLVERRAVVQSPSRPRERMDAQSGRAVEASADHGVHSLSPDEAAYAQ